MLTNFITSLYGACGISVIFTYEDVVRNKKIENLNCIPWNDEKIIFLGCKYFVFVYFSYFQVLCCVLFFL